MAIKTACCPFKAGVLHDLTHLRRFHPLAAFATFLQHSVQNQSKAIKYKDSERLATITSVVQWPVGLWTLLRQSAEWDQNPKPGRLKDDC